MNECLVCNVVIERCLIRLIFCVNKLSLAVKQASYGIMTLQRNFNFAKLRHFFVIHSD